MTVKTFLALALATCIGLEAQAFDATKYASSSRLASGRWVKIEIDKEGMYEITHDQLAEMGFNDPSKVKIYGQGGYLIAEKLDGTATDDLAAVPIGVTNNKIYFYAKGVVNIELANSSTARYVRTLNHYANKSYYFITENDDKQNIIGNYSTTAIWGINLRSQSLDYVYHEQDSYAYGLSGRDFFGESVATEALFNLPISDVVAATPIMVQCAIGAKAKANTSLVCTLGGEQVPFSTSTSTITARGMSGACTPCTTSPTPSRTLWRASPTPSAPANSATTDPSTTGWWRRSALSRSPISGSSAA